jgi:hypothetical protein
VRGAYSVLMSILLLIVIFTFATTTTTVDNQVYGQANPMNLTIADSPDIQNMPAKNRLGDIDVAYKMLGKGDPILLISGAFAGIDYSKLRHVNSHGRTVISFSKRTRFIYAIELYMKY